MWGEGGGQNKCSHKVPNEPAAALLVAHAMLELDIWSKRLFLCV